MKRQVGIREAKARLSRYVDLARLGDDVVITDRGEPVVRLVAIPPTGKRSQDDVLAELADLGLLVLGERRLARRRPIRGRGRISASAVVREMRR